MFDPSPYIFSGIGENFRGVKELRISYSIQFIDRSNFANLEHLDELNLSFNRNLTFIPEDAFWDLPNLTSLRMWICGIEKIPEKAFMNLKKLTFIELSNNKLSHLPKDLFVNNLQLETIQLTENLINRIDVDFTKLTKISSLSLIRNDCIDKYYYRVSSEDQREINKNCTKASL